MSGLQQYFLVFLFKAVNHSEQGNTFFNVLIISKNPDLISIHICFKTWTYNAWTYTLVAEKIEGLNKRAVVVVVLLYWGLKTF